MREDELQEIVGAWIAAQETGRGSAEFEKHEWAVSKVVMWGVTDQSELLWRFITAAYKRDLSDDVSGMLAAGPIEDLLSTFGPAYITRVEELAAKDDRFRSILCGVWRQVMTDEVWMRLLAARRGANCPADS